MLELKMSPLCQSYNLYTGHIGKVKHVQFISFVKIEL